jgi:hypothetical protein
MPITMKSTALLMLLLSAPLFGAAPILTLTAPIGEVASVQLRELLLDDGATGSITFDAFNAAGGLIAPAARGAVFPATPAGLPTETEIRAAITAALTTR